VELLRCTVGPKSHDLCFHVFLMDVGVMAFVVHCRMNHERKGYPSVMFLS